MFQAIRRGVVAAGVLVVSAASQASAVDVSAVTSDVAAQAAPVAAIGGAILLIVVAIKAFKWVRASMS